MSWTRKVTHTEIALGTLAMVNVPRGFALVPGEELPDPEKSICLLTSDMDDLRIAFFRRRVKAFAPLPFLRTMDPDNPAQWSSAQGGIEFIATHNVWVIRNGAPGAVVVAYDEAKKLAVALRTVNGDESRACQLAAETMASITVDKDGLNAWFEAADGHIWTEDERLIRNRRKSRLVLAADGWPIPEQPNGGWLTTDWADGQLVVRDRITTVKAREATWVMERLWWRGFGEGVELEMRDDGNADFYLARHVPLRESVWNEQEKQRFVERKKFLEERIGMLLPLHGARVKTEPIQLPFSDVQEVWPFFNGWAKFTRGDMAWNDGGARGENWSEFHGTYHAVRKDGLILEDAFRTMEELEGALQGLK